jgi:hypothetical protein
MMIHWQTMWRLERKYFDAGSGIQWQVRWFNYLCEAVICSRHNHDWEMQ